MTDSADAPGVSTAALRRTIRRCTALLLIVLGAITAEVAAIEYPSQGGALVGGGAIAAGSLYLVCSALAGLARRSDPVTDSEGTGDDVNENGGNGGTDGSDGDGDSPPTDHRATTAVDDP